MKRLFCIVDIELTDDKEIIQFSATKLDENFNEVSSINHYIRPKNPVSTFVTELTGINNEMLADIYMIILKMIFLYVMAFLQIMLF